MFAAWALAAALVAADPELAPTGQWLVNYDKELCVAARDFGGGREKLTFGLRPFPTQPHMDVVLLDRGLVKDGQDSGQGAIELQPSGQQAKADWRSWETSAGERVLHLNVERDALSELRHSSTLAVTAGNRRVVLQMAAIRQALDALHACETDLITSWGVDPKLFESGVTPPRLGTDIAQLFRADAYPPEAVRAGAQGRTVSLIGIDASGAVSSCRTVESSHFAALDEASCRIMRARAHYAPARDAQGKAVASWALLPVRWVLPGLGPTDRH